MVSCLKKPVKKQKLSKSAKIHQAQQKCIAAKQKKAKRAKIKNMKKAQKLKLKKQKQELKFQTQVNQYAQNQDLSM